MPEKKSALLIGDYSKPQYHPLKGIDHEIGEILKDEFDLVCTEDYSMFEAVNIKEFHLCISYVDCWTEKLNREQVAGILSYVCSGGGLLVIHNGIAIQNRYELAQLVGAKFITHPDFTSLKYMVASAGHPIMDGIEEFEMPEEPYQFEFDSFTGKTVILEYQYGQGLWPAAWAHEFGLGRVVYLSPGHTVDSFKTLMFRKLIMRSSLWACYLI